MRLVHVAMSTAVLIAGAAGAQEQLALSDTGARPVERFIPPAFSDAEVEAFADALYAAVRVDAEWAARIEAAESAEEARRLSQEAQAAMVGAVEAAGVSLQTFRLIYTMVQGDAALAERVSIAIEDRFAG
jgi:hypothetical protein